MASLILLLRDASSLAGRILVEDIFREFPEFPRCSPTALNEAVLVLLLIVLLEPDPEGSSGISDIEDTLPHIPPGVNFVNHPAFLLPRCGIFRVHPLEAISQR